MPRCKNCKEKFEQIHFNQKYCFKEECKTVWIETEKAKQWKKRKAQTKKELLTVQDWLKIAQQAFNAYIRERDKGKPCISCLNDKPKKINAGHFYSSGGHKYLTFDESNVHLQCEHCNTYLSGNLNEYRKNLLERIGEAELKRLDKDCHKVAKYTRQELEEITKKYKQKLKELRNDNKRKSN